MSEVRFGVFLSHNSADKSEVVKLATRLKEMGIQPWLDAWHLVAGEAWLPAIERALQNSDSCAVIIGQHGLGNVHEDEMWVALQRGIESKQSDRKFRIIPILLPGSTRGDRARLPGFLMANTWVEFQRAIDEPAALDKLVKAIRGEAPGENGREASGECPYRGLSFFDIPHASLFFGREALTDWLLSRLRGTATKEGPIRFLAIVGASGSGKSSLARAGVLAKLKAGELPGSERWPIVICRPERRPLESLATALMELEGSGSGTLAKASMIRQLTADLGRSPEHLHLVAQAAMPANDPDWRLVVFVDQFEELFTLNVPDSEETGTGRTVTHQWSADRVAFVQNLLHAAMVDQGRTIVILTMRADFYGKCAAFPQLATAVSHYQELVGPMSPEELRRAIETPAYLSGSDIEPGLVDLLVREITNQPGTLPLLQYALAELWRKSHDMGFTKLTTAAYRELGGWEGALSQRADSVVSEFNSEQQETLCRELFLRLVQLGEGTEDTKRLVRWEEFKLTNASDAGAIETTVARLADSRLITMSGEIQPGQGPATDSTVELVHEALIRGWGRLRQWLDTDRASLRIHRQLTEAANDWARSQTDQPGTTMQGSAKRAARDSSRLYTGRRLADALEWAKSKRAVINRVEREFLDASVGLMRQRWWKQAGMVGGVTLAFLILAGAMAWAWNQSQSTLHAQGLVESLQTAETSEVPRIVSRIEGYRKWANAPLRQAFLAAEEGSQSQLNCALALLPVDAKMIPYLSEQLLTVGSDQFPVVRKGLSPHHDQVIDRLWEEAVKMRPKAQKSFQAACALATYDPDNPRWSEISPAVANHLVTLRPADVVAFRSELFPVRKPLMEPLAAIFRDPEAREQARLYAAETLAEYASEAPEFLFGLMADADEYYFPLIYDALGEHSERLLALGKGELERAVPENANEDELDALARRKANVAVAFLKQNAEDHVWSLLQHRSDPRSRTDLIHRMSRLDVAPQLVLQRFQTETEDSIRRALLLTLGEFSESQLPAEERQLLIPRLLEVCESDPDPGIHAAAEWLLRRWGGQPQIATLKEKLRLNEQQLRSRSATDDRRWYVNSQGQTFVILEAGEFLMGSPLSDPERDESEVPHRVKIGRSVAISSTEVTMEEYERFLQANPNVERINVDRFSQTGDSPRVGIDWYDATRYCNWLSESECLPEDQWCYEPNDEGKFAVGMQPKTDYLQRTGYRLPTEAEWEFACRANSHVSRYFGGCANLLTNYGWYVMNSPGTRSHPVALLKPNDFGLFDTLGNAQEWCDDIHLPYTTNETDDGHSKKVEATDNRVLRGGAFGSQVSGLRCACRDYFRPAVRYYNTGVRPCRTFR